MRIFLFLFLLFPAIELAVLIKVGSSIGVFATLLLLVLSGLAGVMLLRLAGFATAWRARERLARGELPEQEMLQGLLMAVSGGLLILPGLLSDLAALFLLFPPTRRWLIGAARRRVESRVRQGGIYTQGDDAGFDPRAGERPPIQRPNVIEGEYERKDR
ncbi:FxsA family protein [Stutzerimonas urumqiensis]|uniref:FxsA family protein n=1 Tax=Stutzerimonas urumqiensis TaxID=638269 RepID=UPI000EB10EAC|nr:FxsA family protein [Stutzerimonas urumqiensis]